MKKIICMLMVAVMVLTAVPTAVEAAGSKTAGKKTIGVLDVPYYETKLYQDAEFRRIVQAHAVEAGYGYGYVQDAEEYAEYLQKKISTASEFMAWLVLSGYHYDEIEGYMGYVRDGWSVSNTPVINIAVGFGVCCETSTVLAYLLADDYDEIGFVLITGDMGHQYNYIKDGDTYYFVDFTDFTAGGYYTSDEDRWRLNKDRICFWSGKSLDSNSAKKAACQHDNYDWETHGDARMVYDIEWNNQHTAAILTIPCYDGMYVPVSTYRDDCYQDLTQGVEINGHKYYLNEVAIGFQKGVLKDIHVLFLNQSGKYKNAKWKLIEIPVKEVPWYCNIKPGTDKESSYEKMKRQTTDASGNFDYYNYSADESRGIRRGLWSTLRGLSVSGNLNNYTAKQLCSKYNLRTKY